MRICHMMQALKDTGINIFPNEDSHKYVTLQDKNAIAETRLYQQMALTASTMAYSWSKWNGEREPEKIIIQGAPQLADEPLTEVMRYVNTCVCVHVCACIHACVGICMCTHEYV